MVSYSKDTLPFWVEYQFPSPSHGNVSSWVPAFLSELVYKDANFAVVSPGSARFTIAVPEFGGRKLDFNVSFL